MAIKPFNYSNPQKPSPSTGGSIKPFAYKKYIAPAPPSETYKGNVLTEFGSRVGGVAKSFFGGLTTAPAPKSLDMQESLKAGWDTISSTIQDTASRFEKLPSVFSKETSPLDKGVIVGNAALGAINDAFLGVTVPLTAARGIPVVGYVADGVNNLFTALGAGGADIASNAVDGLVFLTPEQQEKIRPLAMEIGALTAQIAAGKGGESFGKIKAKTTELAKTLDTQIKEAKATIETKASEVKTADVSQATIKPFDYSRTEIGGSPIEPQKATATISPEIKSQIDSYLKEDVFLNKKDSVSIETKPISDFNGDTIRASQNTVDKSGVDYFKKQIESGARPAVLLEPTKNGYRIVDGHTRATAYAQLGIKDVPVIIKDVGTKITDLPQQPLDVPKANEFNSRVFERLQAENPEVLTGDLKAERIKLNEDLTRATTALEKNKQEVFDVAMGKKASADYTSTTANILLAEKALADGNNALYARLIKNRSLAQTRRGQEIVSERGSINDNSTSRYVKELLASRLDALGKEYLGDLKLRRVSDKTKATKKIDEEVGALEKKIKTKKLDTKTAIELLDKLACI